MVPTSIFLSRLAGIAGLTLLLAASQGTLAQTTYRWVSQDGTVHYSDQPPPRSETRQVEQKKLKPGNVVETSGPSYAARKAAQNFPLTLYTSANCIENCRIARDFLNRRGLVYTEKVLKTIEDAAAFKQATGITGLTVPVLLAGSKAEKGFEERAWSQLLETAGYPQDAGIPRPKPPANQ